MTPRQCAKRTFRQRISWGEYLLGANELPVFRCLFPASPHWFPHNRDLAYRWMSTRNKAFEGRTPVDVISDFGFAGLLMVRSYLDKMRGQ